MRYPGVTCCGEGHHERMRTQEERDEQTLVIASALGVFVLFLMIAIGVSLLADLLST
jgi:hypothetical protein